VRVITYWVASSLLCVGAFYNLKSVLVFISQYQNKNNVEHEKKCILGLLLSVSILTI
jgi:hypothetical protein